MKAFVLAAAVALGLAAAPGALAGGKLESVALPAAGTLRVHAIVARTRPDPAAGRVLVLHQFRPDYRWQEVLAVRAARGSDGRLWYRLSLPMRPNNSYGWVQARTVKVHPVFNKIVVDRGLRRLEVRRGSRVLFRTTVAVGAPGMETPVGSFYVQVRFVPDDSFLGAYALETSAYSRLTEWPGGGVVGIHGTSRPDLLGQAVSHGCIRVSNAAAVMLRKLAPLGTPIRVVD